MAGNWNERLGWLLVLVGFLISVGLDPWSLSERDPEAVLGSVRMVARHAHAVVLAMGFLQIAVAMILYEVRLATPPYRLGSLIVAVGTLLHVFGYAGWALGYSLTWLIVCGTVVNLAGFILLASATWQVPVAVEIRIILAMFIFSMVIELVSVLYMVDAVCYLPVSIGPEDGVRQRMFRLARVAAIALCLLTLLARRLYLSDPVSSVSQWSRSAVLVGTLGMPTVLTAACFIQVDLKYLLPIPALAMTGGVLCALWQARRTAAPLEQVGWLLIAASMNVGLFVGLYAFDGPLPTPGFVGEYNEFVRRLSRLGHAYCIVFGTLAILLARQTAGPLAALLLLAGSGTTLLGIVLLAFVQQPTAILAPGPALVVLALLAGVRWNPQPTPQDDFSRRAVE